MICGLRRRVPYHTHTAFYIFLTKFFVRMLC
uniref:Uncharacterized protein n=1 Tax=Rhizophora mucronata TaxID=61149 RepID=A0A2P2MPX6_RHIMU